MCLAVVLGFLCQVGDNVIAHQGRRGDGNGSRVAVYAGERGEMRLDNEVAAVRSTSKEEIFKSKRSPSGSTRDPSSRMNCLLQTHPESPGLERGQSLTVASELEISSSASHQVPAPRGSFGRSSLHSSMSSSRISLREPRRQHSVTWGRATPRAGPTPVHWGIALVAVAELVLSAIHNKHKLSSS